MCDSKHEVRDRNEHGDQEEGDRRALGEVGIAGRKLFGGMEPPPEVKKQVTEMIQKNIDIYKVAGWGLIDEVIDLFKDAALFERTGKRQRGCCKHTSRSKRQSYPDEDLSIV